MKCFFSYFVLMKIFRNNEFLLNILIFKQFDIEIVNVFFDVITFDCFHEKIFNQHHFDEIAKNFLKFIFFSH